MYNFHFYVFVIIFCIHLYLWGVCVMGWNSKVILFCVLLPFWDLIWQARRVGQRVVWGGWGGDTRRGTQMAGIHVHENGSAQTSFGTKTEVCNM